MSDSDTGVLKFLRGIDLSKYRGDDWIQKRISRLTNLRWLKLNDLNLVNIPELSSMENLESLSMVNNKISTIASQENSFESLATINLRKNNIGEDDKKLDFKNFVDTITLDLSYNKLRMIPLNVEFMLNLVALNLSNNTIKEIPKNLFSGLTKLVFLDLSHNQIESIPSSITECSSLNMINLSYNPLKNIACRFSSFIQLKYLNLSATRITDDFIFTSFSDLKLITELDLSMNYLTKIPPIIFTLSSLTRLNLCSNKITKIPNQIENLYSLRFLNLSFNEINEIPDEISKLLDLRQLYMNGNKLTSSGIPTSISHLLNLEIFMAAFNELDTIPPSLCRCIKLKKLILRNNNLLTLPDSIYNLKNIELLDTKGNPKLIIPRRPVVSGDAFSKMDFSYENVRNMVFTLIKQQLPSIDITKENLQKQKLNVHKKTNIEKLEEIKTAEAKKFKKQSEARKKSPVTSESMDILKKPIKEMIRPTIEFNDIFSEGIGSHVGLTVFQIENFLPVINENNFGIFFDGDCYIILNTIYSNSSFNHKIYFWIGEESTVDKKACSAMHAVNLRNFLGVDDRTYREEQNNESEEFKSLFPLGINYQVGCGTASSFFASESENSPKVYLYRLLNDPQGKGVIALKTALTSSSLDPRFVFMMDSHSKIYLWFGDKANVTFKNKARLLAEKINKVEKKGVEKIITIDEEDIENSTKFWNLLGENKPEYFIVNPIYNEEHLRKPIIYKLSIGLGYLELPQVKLSNYILQNTILHSDSVYILDFWHEIYVWSGKDTTKIIKEAAKRLAIQIQKFFTRPSYVEIDVINEGYENMIFKSKFCGWNDVLSVDYTLSAEKISKARNINSKINSKSNFNKILTHEDFNLPKMEISSAFIPRQPVISDEECMGIIDDVDYDLERMESFVFDGKKFVKMDENELGHFYSHDCYVFLCHNAIILNDQTNAQNIDASTETIDTVGEEEQKIERRCNVYFWEGRHCMKTGYLNFAFSLKKKCEDLFGDKLIIERIKQQQEPLKFLALFHMKIIYHRGKRPRTLQSKVEKSENLITPRLYQIRCMMGIISRRCVECDLDSSLLCSKLCYLLFSPSLNYENVEKKGGDIFLWVGKDVDETERKFAENIAVFYKKYRPTFQVETIEEGKEPDEFWTNIGGKKPYFSDNLFLSASRLFRCSNESGFYGFKEKCSDFCQDDLNEDDVMLLDTGKNIYLWIGANASNTEKSITDKIAPIYARSCLTMKYNLPRTIIYTSRGQEPLGFKCVFQGFESNI